jgi:hypothetical protein
LFVVEKLIGTVGTCWRIVAIVMGKSAGIVPPFVPQGRSSGD